MKGWGEKSCVCVCACMCVCVFIGKIECREEVLLITSLLLDKFSLKNMKWSFGNTF